MEVKPVPEEPKKGEVQPLVKEEVKTPSEKPASGIVSETKRAKRRVCAQISYLDAKNFAEVEKRVKELKEAGVDHGHLQGLSE